MRYIGVVVAASVSLIAAESAVAYHDNTHRRLSLNAYQHSRLSAPQALLRLGLHPTDRFEGITGGGPEQIPDLVLRGAVSEDYRFHGFAVVTHFFDPAHGGLALNPCPVVCVPSPDWALEDQTSFRLQDSSFRKARLDLFRALRYKDPTAFGRMFEILGRVIHHVEDMAQPQHTRNDLHIPPGYPFGSAIRAAYELTTEHTYGYGTEDVDANVIQQNLDGLEIARARELWMTTDEGVGPAAGRGISQYSNGNFVTQGTNFQGVDRIYAASGGILLIDAGTDPNYVLPSGSAATLTAVTYGQEINDVPEDVEIPISQPPPDAVINWVGTDDLDALLGQTSRNLFTSKLALNAGDLAGLAVSAELPGGFTLGNGNFVEARRRLLPKAVAYSAALLNYFFRGTILSDGTPALRFSLGSFGFGNNVLGGGPASMTLRNASNEDLHGGKLQVFYDTAGGTRALLGEKGIDIRAGKTVTIGSADTGFFRDGATWETLWGPQRAAQGSIVLVYVGSMGAEASPRGDDGSEYAVASRVCTCPPQFDGSGPSSPDDPQLECEQFCCEYLLNASGYPGVPGDGKTVPLFLSDYSSFAGTYGGFDLFPRLRGDLLPNGLTITVFPALPPTQIVGYGATDYMRAGLCSLPNLTNGCVTSFGSGFVQNIVTVDGVTGYPESILPWSFTDTCPFELCSPNICYCGDGNAIPGTQIIELDPCFSSTSCEEGCFCDLSNHLAIDAIAICRDADMYPE